MISEEARGFMTQMLELGLISDSDLEFLIDRIMLSGIPTATVDDVKELIAGAIFHFDAPVTPAGRIMLSGTDRVH